MSDPTLDAALEYVRSFQKKPTSLLGRIWSWYRRATGYEAAVKDRLWREYLRLLKEDGK
jgi:hypothetical protein